MIPCIQHSHSVLIHYPLPLYICRVNTWLMPITISLHCELTWHKPTVSSTVSYSSDTGIIPAPDHCSVPFPCSRQGTLWVPIGTTSTRGVKSGVHYIAFLAVASLAWDFMPVHIFAFCISWLPHQDNLGSVWAPLSQAITRLMRAFCRIIVPFNADYSCLRVT